MINRVRAVIIQDEKVLLIHRIKNEEEYWVFPGGGIEATDATSAAALQRECLEELGVSVSVDSLYARNDNEEFHRCTIVDGVLGTGKGPEFQPDTNYKGRYALEWLPLIDLMSYRVLPEVIKDGLRREQ